MVRRGNIMWIVVHENGTEVSEENIEYVCNADQRSQDSDIVNIMNRFSVVKTV
jgi:hypothetical protein